MMVGGGGSASRGEKRNNQPASDQTLVLTRHCAKFTQPRQHPPPPRETPTHLPPLPPPTSCDGHMIAAPPVKLLLRQITLVSRRPGS